MPLIAGTARVEGAGRARNVLIVGVNHEVPDVFRFRVRQGSFLPPGDPRQGRDGDGARAQAQARAVRRSERARRARAHRGPAVSRRRRDGAEGRAARLRPRRPRLRARRLRRRACSTATDCTRSTSRFSLGADPRDVADAIRKLLMERHRGDEDFTVTTQTEMLDVFGRVLGIVSVAVGGIAGISLVVGAIGILTMMWIGVNERTSEIGLALSIGATRGQILSLFLVEAALLSTLGGIGGVAVGIGIARLAQLILPGLPVETPMRVRRRPRSWSASPSGSSQRRAPGAARGAARSDRGSADRVSLAPTARRRRRARRGSWARPSRDRNSRCRRRASARRRPSTPRPGGRGRRTRN